MNKTKKRFEDFKQTASVQLDLFYLFDEAYDNYTQSIELYDFVPKYVLGKVEETRMNGRYLEPIKRVFESRGKEYQLTLIPARIEIEENIFKDYFLGVREEIVEDVLRKLAAEGSGLMLDDELGLKFSLYQVEQELKASGHTYSTNQIKDALKILATATIQITLQSADELPGSAETRQLKKDKKSKAAANELFFHPLETLAFKDEEEQTSTFVRFSPLISKSIRDHTYRMCNYDQAMKHKSYISRRLFKRMSHFFTQADITKPYTIMLTTLIRDFGLTLQSRLKNNLTNVVTALEEMKENDAILNYKIDRVFDTKRKNKLVDAYLHLTPSPSFSSDARKFNARTVDIRRRLAEKNEED